jgi:hypothetical protein
MNKISKHFLARAQKAHCIAVPVKLLHRSRYGVWADASQFKVTSLIECCDNNTIN